MRNMTYPIWATALLLYLLFLGWHENWRGPLTQDEIEKISSHIIASETLSPDQQQALADFMRSDNGGEFFMVNFGSYYRGEIADPDSGKMMSPAEVLDKYFRPFMGKALRRGSYPALSGNMLGGYIEAWGTSSNPGWTGIGIIRYRSRRDLLHLVMDGDFSDSHIFKKAALSATLATPVGIRFGALLSPRLWVALLLLAFAALAQIMVLSRKGKT